ncbi:MAG TPA: hypothetical protein GX507_01170 [Clostridia bacterium]|nr:hypothetical protein [Clostridia bacterium]
MKKKLGLPSPGPSYGDGPSRNEATGDMSADGRSLSNEWSSLLEKLRDIARSEKRVIEALKRSRRTGTVKTGGEARAPVPSPEEMKLIDRLYEIVRDREAVVNRLRELSATMAAEEVDMARMRKIFRLAADDIDELDRSSMDIVRALTAELSKTLEGPRNEGRKKARSKTAGASIVSGTGSGTSNEPVFMDFLC